jgi:hypothetical protein
MVQWSEEIRREIEEAGLRLDNDCREGLRVGTFGINPRTHPNGTDSHVHFFSSCGQLRITVTGVSEESETGWFTRKR